MKTFELSHTRHPAPASAAPTEYRDAVAAGEVVPWMLEHPQKEMPAVEKPAAAAGRARPEPFTFLSLFSGIGGLDLGLERAGMRCVGQVEIDPFCCRVLAKHWPDVPRFEDVRTVTAGDFHERIDCIAGGFPCQDISRVGKRAGITGAKSGLWSEYFRLICEIRPIYILVENVADLLLGGIGRVLADLASIGFDAEWEVLPAAAFGAIHIRERVFLVGADSNSTRRGLGAFQEIRPQRAVGPNALYSRISKTSWWEIEPDVDRVGDGIPNRMDRMHGLGNAVVPQVAEWIGRRILSVAERGAL